MANETRTVLQPILDYCQTAGIFAQRRNVGGLRRGKQYVAFGKAGQSDLWGILKGGRHFECECKAPGEEPNDSQLQWLADCARQGALAFWVDSLDDFISVIGDYQAAPR